ncbi:MAG: hypothetical protein IT442_14270 [Phycisphaeraceae bacterium]|nr:hypothetical protein [Phycisphaeraceae bacterium]
MNPWNPRKLCRPRQLKHWLYVAAGLLIVAGLAMGGVLIFAPLATIDLDAPPSLPGGVTLTASSSSADASSTPTRESLLALGSLPLRRPLYDTAVAEMAAPTKVVPPLRVKLLGTVIEPGQSVAILQDSAGKTLFLSAGQTVEEATVQSIEPDRVTVRYYDEDRVLLMPKAEPSSSGPDNAPGTTAPGRPGVPRP